jgi:hypothetical protein
LLTKPISVAAFKQVYETNIRGELSEA